MRELTPEDGFPALPKVDLLLYKAPGVSSPAVDALHDYLAHYVGLDSVVDPQRKVRESWRESTPRSGFASRHDTTLAFSK
jgi:hypothetical protein